MKKTMKLWMLISMLILSSSTYAQNSSDLTNQQSVSPELQLMQKLELLTTGLDKIDMSSEEASIALYNAIRFNLPKTVSALINKGMDVNKVLNKKWMTIVSSFAKFVDTTNVSCAPVVLASYYGNIEIVELLIKAGANVNVKTSDNYSILASVMDFDVNDWLNVKKIEGNIIKDKSRSIFKIQPSEIPNDIQRAALVKFKQVVDLTVVAMQPCLDFKKYELSGKTENLDTTLISLIYADYLMFLKQNEALYQLSDRKVKPLVPTDFNNWFARVVASNEQIKVVEALISNGVNLNERRIYGTPDLTYAIDEKHKEIATLLIAAGADINMQTEGQYSHHTTALMSAIKGGSFDIVEQLIKAGADLEVKDISNQTALTYACKRGHEETIQHLIAAGASISDKTMEAAIRKGNVDYLSILIDAGGVIPKTVTYKLTISPKPLLTHD